MTVYNELNKIAYIGNTSQTLYPIPFEYINTEDIKVSIYTSKNEFVEDWRYSTQYIIEGGNVKVLSGYAIDNTKKLLILRRVDLVQDNKYREGGDFPAKSTEASFDKLTMITQQLQETLDRCVKVEVLDIQTPDELLEEVYNKLDSATEVAEQAIGAANQATTAAKDAKDAVVVAQQQITETQAFIEQARADINQTVEDSIEYVEQEAVKAATEVVGEVVGQYTDRAETAAKNAEADASRTAESANRASASATSAATSASEAEAIAGEVSVYNFKNKITNCITEIPQDIKLEFNNGTLTLKAGSKVYVPNGKNADGSNKFDEVVISADKTITVTSNGSHFVFISIGQSFVSRSISACVSGATDSLAGQTYHVWYDTTNNVVNYYTSSGEPGKVSLPLAAITVSNGAISSIDQVFNGFGYIGSTVFALPGVKGLIPNGRNEDGSLKSIEITLSKVLIGEGYGYSGKHPFRVTSSGIGVRPNTVSDTQPESTGYQTWYNPEDNFIYRNEGAGTAFKKESAFIAGLVDCSADKTITSLTPKTAFHAVDRNDSSWIAQQGMLSGKYINLTLGASGTNYTAPANGYVTFCKTPTAVNQYLSVATVSPLPTIANVDRASYVTDLYIYLPVKKGAVFSIYYTAQGATKFFRFIYAEGEI